MSILRVFIVHCSPSPMVASDTTTSSAQVYTHYDDYDYNNQYQDHHRNHYSQHHHCCTT